MYYLTGMEPLSVKEMMTNAFKWLIFSWLILLASIIEAQSPYYFNKKTESGILLAGGTVTGLGLYYRSQTSLLSTDAIASLKKSEVNSFDRIAIENYSTKADRWSDVFWGGTHLLPLLFLSNTTTQNDIAKIGGLYGEVFLLNASITGLIKYTARRARPFVYNPDVDLEKKQSRTARTAFLSGHTSMTAANCFFAAKVFSDYYPDSSWKPFIWTGAALVPALTGYLRIKAGKHYPTDTIAGYALGAAVGVLVPQLHKKRDSRLSAFGGGNGVVVRWRL